MAAHLSDPSAVVSAEPPPQYFEQSEAELAERIAAHKAAFGPRLVILGHHYQMDSVIRFADFRGDSLRLAQLAAQTDAEFVIFAGVHFMAESAAMLVDSSQAVILPDWRAGCSMADMADAADAQTVWEIITNATGPAVTTVPITYVNSTAAIKAFVADRGGAVCTSSNAEKIIRWALDAGEKLLFLPDQHLGRNVAAAMGIPLDEMVVYDPAKPDGGLDSEAIRRARIVLWNGFCSVHMGFSEAHVAHWRTQRPTIRVIVHPECRYEVVQAADLAGSTGFIIDTIRQAEAGTEWAVGTEIHLVKRLQAEHPDKFVTSLSPFSCLCTNMYRIRPPYLAWVLDNLVEGRIVNRVCVPAEIAASADVALRRMLAISE